MAPTFRRPQPPSPEIVLRDIVAGPTSGPGAIPQVDPAARRDHAWQDGTVAAGVSTHDVDSLTHAAPLIYAARVDAEHGQWQSRALQDCSHDQQVAQRLLGIKEADLMVAREDLAHCERETGQVTEEVEGHRQILRGDGPDPGRQWQAPDRLRESATTTWFRIYLLVSILAFADVGINVLALQTLGGGTFELVSFALVLGVFAVVLGHQAGVHLRRHPRSNPATTWSERWLLPLGYAVAGALVVSFLATLRLAYIATPVPDPTGVESQSMLGAAGVAGWVIWMGLAALQFGLGVAVAVHTHHVHNPYVAAHRIGRTLQSTQAKAITEAKRRVELAVADVAAAKEDLTVHIPAQWAAQSAALSALARQVLAIYADAYVHAGGNPELTVAMEARLATQRGGTVLALGPAAPDRHATSIEARPKPGDPSPERPPVDGDTSSTDGSSGQDGRAA